MHIASSAFPFSRRAWAGLGALLAAALCVVAAPAHAQAPAPVWLSGFSSAAPGPAPEPWHFTTLPHKNATHFEVVRQDGRSVLKVEADGSYGNLVHPVRVALDGAATLAWRWRVERFVDGADLRSRSGDDGAAKLCVFFALPTERLPFGERTRLALARSATGEDVPSETLCYVWDAKEAKSALLPNAFTRRIRMLVLESGPAGAGADGWRGERRNLLADYQRAFGDEAGGLQPDIVGVAISADADNTEGHGLAFFSDLEMQGTPAVPQMQGKRTAVPP
ncbi:DUF3047 domain-containing protein [Variovorax sp. ZT4R33]|uniref:DUF3047 domain-containing protein n=1 Tax=Variovorax sp. ZT4R33 TaxID=3443743 RepID=UPI003F464325